MTAPLQERTGLVAVSGNCATLLEQAEHVVIGLSPFNSYYTPDTVHAVVGWAADRFARVDVLLPGWETAVTLVSCGVQPFAAVRRARRAVQRLRVSALRVLAEHGVPDAERRVRTWTGLLDRAPYRALRQQVALAYQRDPVMRELCRDTCRSVLAHHGLPSTPSPGAVDLAVGYVLAEVPFLLDSPAVYGVSGSLFLYHRTPPLVRALYDGAVPSLTPSPGQGYAALTAITS